MKVCQRGLILVILTLSGLGFGLHPFLHIEGQEQPAITVKSWNMNIGTKDVTVYPLDPTKGEGLGYRIMGQLINNSTQAFHGSQMIIVGEFYDKNEKFFGVSSSYPETPMSPGGGTAPFEMFFIAPTAAPKESIQLGHLVLTISTSG